MDRDRYLKKEIKRLDKDREKAWAKIMEVVRYAKNVSGNSRDNSSK